MSEILFCENSTYNRYLEYTARGITYHSLTSNFKNKIDQLSTNQIPLVELG